MIIERNTGKYRVYSEESLRIALEKISSNKSGYLVAVSADGRVEGIITDGDIRRWLSKVAVIDLNVPAISIANTGYLSLPYDTPRSEVVKRLDDRVRVIPLVDEAKHLVAIARLGHADLTIGKHHIGESQPVFIIAEIGNNHNGDVELAKQLVDLAIASGADCAKFQMRDMQSLYASKGNPSDAEQDLGAQYTLDLLAKYNLSKAQLFEIFDYCKTKGIEPLCTPWDEISLDALEEYGMNGYKVASADLTNHTLLRKMARTGKTLICSTGMASEAEIRASVELLRAEGAPFVLLHVNSTYPTPYKDVNLNYIPRLSEIAECPIGYSGHERGWFVPVAAVALGAKVVEKHFTIDRSMEGNDHKVSLLPEEFREMVHAIRSTELALGTNGERVITQGEMMNREVLAKSLHAARDIKVGEIILAADVLVQSPGQGLQPNRMPELIGRTANRDIKSGTPFFPTDMQDKASQARDYNFPRPWGIPVRWHDYRKMLNATNLSMLEYHLSYKDMDEKLEDWFNEVLDIDFTVHAPELFSGDHILDLSAEDDAYRNRSISELQRVCDLTRQLKKWHGRCTTPVIITNMGGFRTEGFLPKEEREYLYARIEDALSHINTDGVEIIPQTMPPFPWHFGGQSHHNLFMDPDEIAVFCERNRMRVCLDVSHSQLACNFHDWSMAEFCRKVGPFTAHLHIVDAKGVDGEGLQIGEGDMDFGAIAGILDATCPKASFVPEVWQGHKNSGAGFWLALDKLEEWFGAKK